MSELRESEIIERLEEIQALLEEGDPESALEAADALVELVPGNLDAVEFRGTALMDLGDFEAAIECFDEVIKDDPKDPTGHILRANALLELGRLKDAEAATSTALALEPKNPDALATRAWIHDVAGRAKEADADYRAVHKADPESPPPPMRKTQAAFEALVEAAHAELPEEFRRGLDNVAITIHDFPSLDLVTDPDCPVSLSTLGYFDGVALPDRHDADPMTQMPSHIQIFKRNLERQCDDEDSLREQVTITLQHEIAHYFGWDEDDVARMGLE